MGSFTVREERLPPITPGPAHTAATRQGSNVYGSWGQTGVAARRRLGQHVPCHQQRDGKDDARDARQRRWRGGVAPRTGAGNIRRRAQRFGDVYAGHDGNVGRKGDGWQKHNDGGSWNNVQQPTQAQRDQAQQRATQAQGNRPPADSATMGQLNRDSAARAEGAQRTVAPAAPEAEDRAPAVAGQGRPARRRRPASLIIRRAMDSRRTRL